ncbi:hypothetical protein OSTOST_24386, partial [Ostertagia ostertagi]
MSKEGEGESSEAGNVKSKEKPYIYKGNVPLAYPPLPPDEQDSQPEQIQFKSASESKSRSKETADTVSKDRKGDEKREKVIEKKTPKTPKSTRRKKTHKTLKSTRRKKSKEEVPGSSERV